MKYLYALIFMLFVFPSFGQYDDEEGGDRKTISLDDNIEKYLNDGMNYNAGIGISTSLSDVFRGLVGVDAIIRIPETQIFLGGGYSTQLFSGYYMYQSGMAALQMGSDHTIVWENFDFKSGSSYSFRAGYAPKLLGFANGVNLSFLYKNVESKYEMLSYDFLNPTEYQLYTGDVKRQFFNFGLEYRLLLQANFFLSVNQEFGLVRTTSKNTFDPYLFATNNNGEYKPKTMNWANYHFNISIGYFIN